MQRFPLSDTLYFFSAPCKCRPFPVSGQTDNLRLSGSAHFPELRPQGKGDRKQSLGNSISYLRKYSSVSECLWWGTRLLVQRELVTSEPFLLRRRDHWVAFCMSAICSKYICIYIHTAQTTPKNHPSAIKQHARL